MGRKVDGDINIKHKIKKVDRLESNKHLYKELSQIYSGLSSYIFTYLTYDTSIPIIIDLCYIADKHNVQMLSAEVALKGRSLPLYRDIFDKNGLKNRAKKFLNALSNCIPKARKVLIIMDAGFGDDWFKEIELLKLPEL